MKYKLKRILLVLISISIFVLQIKLLDRIVGFSIEESQISPSYSRTAKYQTSEYAFTATTNNIGFRDINREQIKKKGIVRILAIGDSFSYCWGVEKKECWLDILEKSFNENAGTPKIEIINLGIPGASLYQYLETAQKYIPLYKPDYVMIGLVEGNDFVQLVSSPEKTRKIIKKDTELKRSQILKQMDHYADRTIKFKGAINNYLLKYLPNIYTFFDKDKTIDISSSFKNNITKYIYELDDIEIDRFNSNITGEMKQFYLTGKVNPELFLYSLRIPEYFTLVLNDKEPRFNEGLEIMKNLIGQINEEAIKNKAKTIVIDIPYGVYVSSGHIKTYSDMGFEYSNKAWESELPLKIIRDSLSPEIIFFKNLPLFRQKCGTGCFYKYDDHLTIKGNKLLAENMLNSLILLLDNTIGL